MTTKRGYWLGALLIVTGVVGALAFGVLSFAAMERQVDAFQRVPVPGQGTVRLDDRKYVVYVEAADGDERLGAFELFVLDPRTNQPLPVGDYSSKVTYTVGGHAGRARATVTPPSPGRYDVRVAAAGDPASAVAFGPSIGGRIVTMVVGTLLIGGLLGGGGLALLITTAVRRSTAKRRAAPAGLEG